MEAIKIARNLHENVESINDAIPDINSGGCGIFAEHLYKTLIKLGLKPTIVIITNDIDRMPFYVENKELYLEESDAYIRHVMIELDTYLIDSKGVYFSLEETKWHCEGEENEIEISIELLTYWNSKPELWNPWFNRDHIKTIETKLNKCYNKIKKSLVVSK